MNPTTIAEMQSKAAELRAKYPGQAVIVEAQIHEALDPAKKQARALARAAELEVEAAKLRASVAGNGQSDVTVHDPYRIAGGAA